jgi:hypothetical protein
VRPSTAPAWVTATRRPTRRTSWTAELSAPVEPCWSKLGARLRAVGARSREAPGGALGPALAAITARDARGWSRLAGHAPAN